MDALKFIQERQRMCDSYNDDCMGCLMCGQYCGIDKGVDAERLVEVVELWSKENPRKTRQELFLEQHPEANIENGVLDLCPIISGVYEDSNGYCIHPNRSCGFCRREFWWEEV